MLEKSTKVILPSDPSAIERINFLKKNNVMKPSFLYLVCFLIIFAVLAACITLQSQKSVAALNLLTQGSSQYGIDLALPTDRSPMTLVKGVNSLVTGTTSTSGELVREKFGVWSQEIKAKSKELKTISGINITVGVIILAAGLGYFFVYNMFFRKNRDLSDPFWRSPLPRAWQFLMVGLWGVLSCILLITGSNMGLEYAKNLDTMNEKCVIPIVQNSVAANAATVVSCADEDIGARMGSLHAWNSGLIILGISLAVPLLLLTGGVITRVVQPRFALDPLKADPKIITKV
jgi:hypothetical protein